MILQNDSNSWEAYFYFVFHKSMSSTIAEIQSSAVSLKNCLSKVVELLKKSSTENDDFKFKINEISEKLLYFGRNFAIAAYSHYQQIDESIIHKFAHECSTRIDAIKRVYFKFADVLYELKIDDKEIQQKIAFFWLAGIKLHENFHYLNVFNDRHGGGIYHPDQIDKKDLDLYGELISQLDPSYKITVDEYKNLYTKLKDANDKKLKSNSSGCYIATSIYGSYDCSQVWILRRYRDYTLAETWYGRSFIKAYYAISPTLVKLFGHKKWFRKMWKGKLDRMVTNLKAEGIEDTPYEDRNW